MLATLLLESHGQDTLYEPKKLQKNPTTGFPTRSDINRAVQPQKMARGLKFRI